MARPLKLVLDPAGGTLRLPVCSAILSVGYQRERSSNVKFTSLTWGTAAPITGIDPSKPLPPDVDRYDESNSPGYAISSQLLIEVTAVDVRSRQRVSRTLLAPGGSALDPEGVEEWYKARGYDEVTVKGLFIPTAAPHSEAPAPSAPADLVPVLWFQSPAIEELDEEDVTSPWPHATLRYLLVPTGDSVADLCDYTFVGTLSRPQRADPSKDSVVHVYVETSSFIKFR